MRIGVFGGTFDPVHLAHLVLAEQCREQGRLDRVLFVPAARPPHKQERPLTPFHQRVEMLGLALAGQPAFQIEQLEKDRAGPSYTVDTLETLQRNHPGAELWLLIGTDTLHDLANWYQPSRIAELAGLMVVSRPEWEVIPAERMAAAIGLSSPAALRQEIVHMPLIAIASRDLRQRAAEGRSLRYLVPRSVEAYIHDKGLYKKDGQNPGTS
jgi:nicotinate-nucleotide adenylyltransferase